MAAKGLKSHFLLSTPLISSPELTQLFAAICVLQAETAWRKKIPMVTRSPAQSLPCFTHQGPELLWNWSVIECDKAHTALPRKWGRMDLQCGVNTLDPARSLFGDFY